jgi:hypothetical protein
MTDEVLAFDWGTTVIGILDVNGNAYTAYRYGKDMVEGANRIISSAGIIVSFNGNGRDLIEVAKMLGFSSVVEMNVSGEHNDMMKITSDIRWPPDPGSASILGPGLIETYRYYFGDKLPIPPVDLQDDYIISNWRDCYMTAELWKKWKRGELVP